MKKVYSKSKEELFKELGVNKDGLNDTEVKSMEEKYGKNELVEGKKKSTFQVFLDQVVLHPVGADRSSFPISDQFIWIKGNFKAQVVVDHDLHSLSSCAFSFVLIDWFSVDTIFWTEAIAIDETTSF